MDTPTRIFSLLLLLFFCSTAHSTCPEADQIHCFTGTRCTRIRYICDGDNDCGDNSDEESSLCAHWRNNDCERNSALCERNGRRDCVTISHYCTLSDPPCNGTVDLRLCEMLKLEKLIPFNAITPPTTIPPPTEPMPTEESIHVQEEDLTKDIDAKLDVTLRHEDCPQLFTRIGKQCVSVFFVGNVDWLEARAFCKTIKSDLYTLSSEDADFPTLMQHLRNSQVTTDFWIGGRYVNETVGWTWVNDAAMVLGSPYWAVRHTNTCQTRSVTSSVLNVTRTANNGQCYNYSQAPMDPPTGHCAAITYAQYYYVSDEDCYTKKSPLCVTKLQSGPDQAL